MRWMRRMVWWLVNRTRRDSMYRIELFVLSACGMYVCLSRVSLHASPHILCHSRCLLHRLETETRRAALDAAAATGAEAATRRSCADARAALFLGRGGVVVHAVAGDVLVVHAGLRGLDAGVRGGEGAYRWLAAASQQRHWGRGHTWRSSRRPEDTGRGEVRRTRAGAGRRRTGLQTWRWAGE